MSQQVRFAPANSLDVVYVRHGHVTISRADGTEVAIAPGHHPDWVDGMRVVFCPPEDGVVQLADVVSGIVLPTGVPAGNTLTASAGKVAVHRTDPRRTICSWGETFNNVTDPALSADGRWLAVIAPDHPRDGVSMLAVFDADEPIASSFGKHSYVGAPLRPRFSHTGTSLCWEEAGGAIYGIRDVANHTSPVVRLSRPGDQCYHPVPIWCPERSELLLCYVQAVSDTEADVIVAGWESCVAQQPSGYVVARSGGSGFDMDAKEAA
jgi:hypothetical protein